MPPLLTLDQAAFAFILDHLPRFWGERDVSALHHPMFLHEFGDLGRVATDADGAPAAYLLGCIATSSPTAYAHVIAVRDDQRRRGLARKLYRDFAATAHARGARTIKAICRPENEPSRALHHTLGMAEQRDPHYSGPGQARLVFTAPLPLTD